MEPKDHMHKAQDFSMVMSSKSTIGGRSVVERGMSLDLPTFGPMPAALVSVYIHGSDGLMT